jgi:hypothetical protein
MLNRLRKSCFGFGNPGWLRQGKPTSVAFRSEPRLQKKLKARRKGSVQPGKNMNHSHPWPETSQVPLAQLTGSPHEKARRAVLVLVLNFLVLACGSANAGNESLGDDNKVVWQNPTPQLSQNAARSLVAAQLGGLDSAGYVLVIVRLEAGKAMEVRSLMSSGSLIADKEICQFVLDHWVFNPKATGVYKFPVRLPTGL